MDIKQFSNKIITFLKEAKLELKKVNWPTRQETLKYTLIVVCISIAVAIFLGGLDVVFNRLLERILNL
ncbi:MAG: preprotein translocase subunit SecE [Minisyncoccales bacterium]